MKNNLNFTPHQLETWVAVLSVFESIDVARACLEIGLSEDPFPDLGKLVHRCESIRRQRSPQVFRDDNKVLSSTLVERIAVALDLKICNG